MVAPAYRKATTLIMGNYWMEAMGRLIIFEKIVNTEIIQRAVIDFKRIFFLCSVQLIIAINKLWNY
jgi:hypothetical protein